MLEMTGFVRVGAPVHEPIVENTAQDVGGRLHPGEGSVLFRALGVAGLWGGSLLLLLQRVLC